MSDIGPGDVVVCVKWSPPKSSRVRYIRSPDSRLRVGRHYRVTKAFRVHDVGAVLLREIDPVPGTVGFPAARFRKLNDTADDAELIERIKGCQPAKQRIPA